VTLALPRALEPWRPLLSLLPVDVALALSPAVLRLAAALGPMLVRARSGDGEPDGFDGLARRGSYERLLLSEWLLAEEAPLEFVRRAAVGEHAFLEILRRDPARSLATMAVFEAGPDQLGAPRLAQLAALLVLARRASAAGAVFHWGFLHVPGDPARPCQTAADVTALVDGRTRATHRPDDLGAWRRRARAEGVEELWFVGSPGAASQASREGGSALAIEQIVHPTKRAVEVTITRPSRPSASVVVDLPEERLCARALRDPFDVAQPEFGVVPAPKRPVSNLVFSSNGRKLFARAQGGGVVSIGVPNSPRAGASQPKLYVPRSRKQVVAAGWHQRNAIVATAEGDRLELTTVKGRSWLGIDQSAPLPAGSFVSEPDRITSIVFLRYGPKLVPLVPDAAGTLFELGDFFEAPIEVVARDLKAIAARGDRVVLVARGHELDDMGLRPRPAAAGPRPDLLPAGSGFAMAVMSAHYAEKPPQIVPLDGDGTFEAFFGWPGHHFLHNPLLAVQQRGRAWSLHAATGVLELFPDEGATVVGVTFDAGEAGGPSLVLLDRDRRRLSLVGRKTSRALLPSADPIVHVAASHAGPEIAYLTTTGRLVVLSPPFDRPLLLHAPAESP
jgi:hypothetical protein